MHVGQIRLIVVCDVYAQEANGEGSGGYAQLATLVKQLRTERSLVCLCGDFLAGSSLADKFKGENVVAVMNEIGIDVVVFGNHEFDYGDDVLEARMRQSSALWLGSNVIDRRTGAPFGGASDRHCFDFSFPLPHANGDGSGGDEAARELQVRLGMFGVCTDDTRELSYPSDEIEFQCVEKAAKRALDELDADGADVVVGLTHLSLLEDQRLAAALAGHTQSHNRLADSQGLAAGRRRQPVTALLGGHDHLTHTSLKHGMLVMKCGQDAHHVGVIDIHVRKSGAGDDLEFHCDWRMVANRHVEADEAVVKIINGFKAAVHSAHDPAYLQEVLTTVQLGPLSTLSSEVRTRSTFIGNFLADCIRDTFRYVDPRTSGEASERQADVAVINSGTVRGNRTYASGAALTRIAVMEEFPMRLEVDVVELTGSQLRQVLEQHLAKYPEPSGCFPNVTRNVRVKFDGSKPRFERIQELLVDGRPATPQDRYQVATSSFLSGGGDGCTAYKEGVKVVSTEEKMLSLLDTYLCTSHRTIADAATCENRVKDTRL
mmetsp:Transcript_8291/g.34803  ORF Transcript_8291/g.34803 Transcript_8291/m.34803 type:complete len:544 (+) Transcript_8291:56-1687(+)